MVPEGLKYSAIGVIVEAYLFYVKNIIYYKVKRKDFIVSGVITMVNMHNIKPRGIEYFREY